MERDQAQFLSEMIESSMPHAFETKKLETVNAAISKFHQWANGKFTLAGYEVIRPSTDTGYYFLFIDWHRNGSFYLVIYAHDKSTTVAELRQVENFDGMPHIVWTYKPLKRDGKNDLRKAYFKQLFGSTTIHIKFPSSVLEVEKFLEQLFKLCQNRIKADTIVDVFDFENKME